MLLCKGGETTLVDPCLHVAVADSFEIDHRRGDVAVPHPLLQRSYVDAVLQVSRRVRVPKLVKEPAATVRPFGTPIDFYGPVFQLVAHSAMTAVQLSAKHDRLKFFEHGAIGPASGTWEDRIVG